MGMSDEDVGIYIKMLAFQWDRGGLPNCPKSIKNIINSKRKPSELVMKKFKLCDDGSIKNDRLEKERQKQISFRESRSDNAKRRWEKDAKTDARASGSTCKNDALQSSSSPSPSGIPPLPPKGDAGKDPDLFETETSTKDNGRVLPDRWKNIPKIDRRNLRVLRNNKLMVRIGGWFNRKASNLWTLEEGIKLSQIQPDPDDVDTLESWYLASDVGDLDIRRRDLATLLNNWTVDLDRARLWKSENQ